jgi:peptidylprolyl isomerase
MSKKEIAKLPKLTIAKQSGPPPRRLEVIDLRKGSGAVVTRKDAVFVRYLQVNYAEALQRSRTGLYGPRSFGLDEVVKGWRLGLPGMKVGGRRELILPPRLVYPRWKPSWGYTPYTDIYLIDLLKMEKGGGEGF